ncbi:MAG: sodium/proline symporter, partial [Hyphomonas sp.]
SEPVAIMMLVLGVGIALFWRFGLGWHESIYEGLPGILVPLVIGAFLSKRREPAEAAAAAGGAVPPLAK